MKRYIAGPVILLFFLISMATSTSAQSIGTAPGVMDLGELERGNTYESYFYVTTRGIASNFAVKPRYERAPRSLFSTAGEEGGFDPELASQEDLTEWVDFNRDTVLVDPNERNVAQLDGGGTVVYNERLRFEIQVPEDAEPGYHVGAVDLRPDMDRSGEGASSVLNLALTQPIFYFKVPGVAKRDLNVIDVRAIRSGENEARFDYIVENNGTVTTWVSRSSSELHDKEGEKMGMVDTGGMYVSPNEKKVISTEWRSDVIEGGEYRVTGQMNYITGRAFVDKMVDISEVVQVQSTDSSDEDEGSLPTWIVFMLLALIGVVMYSFEIDPLYIIGALGLAGIIVLILTTGIPTYFIAILIAATALGVIGGRLL